MTCSSPFMDDLENVDIVVLSTEIQIIIFSFVYNILCDVGGGQNQKVLELHQMCTHLLYLQSWQPLLDAAEAVMSQSLHNDDLSRLDSIPTRLYTRCTLKVQIQISAGS